MTSARNTTGMRSRAETERGRVETGPDSDSRKSSLARFSVLIEPTSRLYEQSPVKEPAQVHLWNAMLGKVTRTNNSGLPSQLEDELCFASYRHLLQNVCRYNYVPTFCNRSVWISQLLFLSRQSGW